MEGMHLKDDSKEVDAHAAETHNSAFKSGATKKKLISEAMSESEDEFMDCQSATPSASPPPRERDEAEIHPAREADKALPSNSRTSPTQTNANQPVENNSSSETLEQLPQNTSEMQEQPTENGSSSETKEQLTVNDSSSEIQEQPERRHSTDSNSDEPEANILTQANGNTISRSDGRSDTDEKVLQAAVDTSLENSDIDSKVASSETIQKPGSCPTATSELQVPANQGSRSPEDGSSHSEGCQPSDTETNKVSNMTNTKLSAVTESAISSEGSKSTGSVERASESTGNDSTLTGSSGANTASIGGASEVVSSQLADSKLLDSRNASSKTESSHSTSNEVETKTEIAAEIKQPTKDIKREFNIPPIKPEPDPDPDSKEPSAQDVKDGHAYLKPTAKFLYKTGLTLLREVVYDTLLTHISNTESTAAKKYTAEQQDSLRKSLASIAKENAHLKLNLDKVCEFTIGNRVCNFRTESQVVLEAHFNEAHYNQSQRLVCALCSHELTLPGYFKTHMFTKHGASGSVIKPPSFYYCKLCPYETNIKERLETHRLICQKGFTLSTNLKPRADDRTPYQDDMFNDRFYHSVACPTSNVITNPYSTVKSNLSTTTIKSPLPITIKPQSTVNVNGKTDSGPLVMTLNYKNNTLTATKIVSQKVNGLNPSISKPNPLAPRPLPPPPQNLPSVTQLGGGKAINPADVCKCELCSGMIQGVQALKVHMQWCHNINIAHLNSPNFKCQLPSCTQHFWTIQGLAAHIKVCPAAAASRPTVAYYNDKESCFICRQRLFASLVSHILGNHLADLKMMVEKKTCLGSMCMGIPGHTLSFKSVDHLQSHLSSHHRVVLTGLTALSASNVNNIKFQPFCSICKLKFNSSQEFASHCASIHVHKCDICGAQCSTPESVKEHVATKHRYRFCLVCKRYTERSSFSQHLVSAHHITSSKVNLKRLSSQQYEQYSKKPRPDGWN